MYRSFKNWVSGGSKTSLTPKEALNNSKGEVGLNGQNNVETKKLEYSEKLSIQSITLFEEGILVFSKDRLANYK